MSRYHAQLLSADHPTGRKRLTKSMGIELKKLHDNKQAQEETLKHTSAIVKQGASPNDFAQEILRILEREIPKLNRNQPPDFPSTSGFGPSSSSTARRHRDSSMKSSSPPRPNAGGQETGLPSQLEEVSGWDREAPCGGVCPQEGQSKHHVSITLTLAPTAL
jgi:hypothetical protein